MDEISAPEWCLDVTKIFKIHNKQIRKSEEKVWKASWCENPVFFRNNETSSQICQG